MWDEVSSTFMKDDKPYDPGDFRIRGGQFISLKLAEPEITFKPLTKEQLADWRSAVEPTEPWMADVAEIANRSSARIIRGNVGGSTSRVFEERAQNAAWWLAPDWNTLYVATGWQDHHAEVRLDAYAPTTSKLFKSVDQGEHWQRLNWSENHNITFLRFLDAERGYAIGWGPHIWRTADGGASWSEIPVPAEARGPANGRKQFDVVVLGRDGVLRVAFTVPSPAAPQEHVISHVYALRWGDDVPYESFHMTDHTVADIADNQGHIYVLSWRGKPLADADEDALRPSVVSRLDRDGVVRALHEFDPELRGYALYFTPQGSLLVDGVNDSRRSEVTALSRDGGKHWHIQSEGSSYAQGGYYDAVTGIDWRVEGYSLYKRSIL